MQESVTRPASVGKTFHPIPAFEDSPGDGMEAVFPNTGFNR